MRDDFAVFILTHGRANNQKTYKTLMNSGYTGKIFLIIDDEDDQGEEYKRLFGDQVIEFSKKEAEKTFDTMINKKDYRSVVYARNAAYKIAESLGVRFVLMCDDDISAIRIRLLEGLTLACYNMANLDAAIDEMCSILENDGISMLGFSQAGMYIGGANQAYLQGYKNNVSQMFMVDAKKPVVFRGLLNEDLHVGIDAGIQGMAAMSTTLISIQSPERSSNTGGLQELYHDNGSYIRAFYSVVAFPGAVKIREKDGEFDVSVDSSGSVPMVLHERWKK